jgi:serine/threonine protein kinase
MLEAHDRAGGFLEEPVIAVPQRTEVVSVPPTQKPGDRIGHYKLLEQIGEGGCGVVYVAEQEEPVRRRVALKVIKLGMDTKAVIARFEAERQALALMDHPNIAKVLRRGRDGNGPPVLRDGTGARRQDHRLLRPEQRPHPNGSICSCKSVTPFSTPIRRGSSIGTSSPRTSW